MTRQRGDGKLKFIDRNLGIPLVAILGALRFRKQLPREISRIALFKEACIGDTIILSAILKDLRKAYPDSELLLFTGPTNFGIGKMLPDVDLVVELPVTSPLRCIRELRKHQVDLFLDFGPWPRINALYTLLSKAKCTVGFETPGQARHYAYDLCVPHRGDRHELDNYRALLDAIHVPTGSEVSITPANGRPGIQSEFVVFHPWPGGTLSHVREWPESRWIELAAKIHALGYELVITGGPGDRDRAEALCSAIRTGAIQNRAGIDDLGSVTTLLAGAIAVVSVNTGIMHLAAAIGAPTIGLNGPTAEHRWGPLGPRAESVSVPPPYGGYLNLGFEYAGQPLDSMERITVEQVWERIQRIHRLRA